MTLHFWNRFFPTKFEQTTKPFLLLFILGTSSQLKAVAKRDRYSDVEENMNSDTESEEEGREDGHSEEKKTDTHLIQDGDTVGTFHFPSHPLHISQ